MEQIDPLPSVLRERWPKLLALGLSSLPSERVLQLVDLASKGDWRLDELFSHEAHYWGGQVPLQTFASAELKAKAQGIYALCMTETHGGSDPWSLKTTATVDGDYYLVSGEKNFITNALLADFFLTYASGPQGRPLVFLIPADADNVWRTPLSLRGFERSGMGNVGLRGVRIPQQYVIAGAELAQAVFQESMNGERVMMMALCVGRMQFLFTQTLAYCRQRRLKGHDGVLSALALMKLRLENSQNVLVRAATALAQRKEAVMWAALCKIQVAQSYQQLALSCSELWAARGLESSHFLAQDLDWAQAASVYSGTTAMMEKLVGKLL